VLLGIFVGLGAEAVAAQAPLVEFRVNTSTTGPQLEPSVAMDATGRFIVVWESFEQYGSPFDVLGQRYDAAGAPLGPEFQIGGSENFYSPQSSVAMDASGRFVVVWVDHAVRNSSQTIRARIYDANGSPAGEELEVDSDWQARRPHVAIDDEGAFVVVWQGAAEGELLRVLARRFDASGEPLGDEFQVNQATGNGSIYPVVATGGDGAFVVAWNHSTDYGYPYSLYARRYDSSGSPVCEEFVVQEGAVTRADLETTPSSGALIAWSEVNPDSSLDVMARNISNCSPVGDAFLVNTLTTGFQSLQSVASDGAGNFIVTWDSGQFSHPDNSDVFAKRFAADGSVAGADLAVNQFTDGPQQGSAVAMNSDGASILAWYGQDRELLWYNIFARRLPDAAPTGLDVDRHPASGSTTNINGVLEAGETVRVEPVFLNGLTSPLELVGTASAFTGPPGPAYGIEDDSASYGAIPVGGSASCGDATADCLEIAVTGARPAAHWDGFLEETLSNGDTQNWALHIGESFDDVPPTHMFYADIESLFHNGVTEGCGEGAYCPAEPVRRDQMAVFLLKAIHGGSYQPTGVCFGVFIDVPCDSPFSPWIERLVLEGLTAGCGKGRYCPESPVRRAQMAVFLLKARNGSVYVPPRCEGLFSDVPCPGLFADWIEELSRQSITAGCGGGRYCPEGFSTRGQMAAFLTKAFGLRLYGP
jgi:hypothetical protein